MNDVIVFRNSLCVVWKLKAVWSSCVRETNVAWWARRPAHSVSTAASRNVSLSACISQVLHWIIVLLFLFAWYIHTMHWSTNGRQQLVNIYPIILIVIIDRRGRDYYEQKRPPIHEQINVANTLARIYWFLAHAICTPCFVYSVVKLLYNIWHLFPAFYLWNTIKRTNYLAFTHLFTYILPLLDRLSFCPDWHFLSLPFSSFSY